MNGKFRKTALSLGLMVFCGPAFSHQHHAHGVPLTEKEQRAAAGVFADQEVKDRKLSDWDGIWQSVYPLLNNGDLDVVFRQKAAKDHKTFASIKEYYRKGYATKVDRVGIEAGVIEFHRGNRVNSCHYTYSGYKILHYATGKKGVRYLFECNDAASRAPKYVQFSDHTIGPRKSAHFHLFMGDSSQQALLKEMDNWPTWYPYQLYAEQVVDEMLHH